MQDGFSTLEELFYLKKKNKHTQKTPIFSKDTFPSTWFLFLKEKKQNTVLF